MAYKRDMSWYSGISCLWRLTFGGQVARGLMGGTSLSGTDLQSIRPRQDAMWRWKRGAGDGMGPERDCKALKTVGCILSFDAGVLTGEPHSTQDTRW